LQDPKMVYPRSTGGLSAGICFSVIFCRFDSIGFIITKNIDKPPVGRNFSGHFFQASFC